MWTAAYLFRIVGAGVENVMRCSRCPACNASLNASLPLGDVRYSEPFRCRYCGIELLVAPYYLPLVGWLTLPASVGLIWWLVGFETCLSWILLAPVNLALTTFALQALVLFWPPPLVRARLHEFLTTLSLSVPDKGSPCREGTDVAGAELKPGPRRSDSPAALR